MSDGTGGPGEGRAVVGDEQRRLSAVRRYDILDTPPDGAFDRVAALAARCVNVRMATVTIVDEDRIWFKAAHGLEGMGQTHIGRDPGLCASAILQDEPYVLPDTLKNAQAVTNPLVRGELGLRFYAAAPIITHDGYRLGTVNVLDTSPGELTAEQRATLQDLAAVVTGELELRISGIRTVRLEHELRRSQENQLKTAMESHAVIDQAIGALMLAHRCEADTAWSILQRLSQNTNTKLRVVAETLLQSVSGAPPTELDAGLRKAVQQTLTPAQSQRR